MKSVRNLQWRATVLLRASTDDFPHKSDGHIDKENTVIHFRPQFNQFASLVLFIQAVIACSSRPDHTQLDWKLK